jgi:hypothetical protein
MFKRKLDESRMLRWFPLAIAALCAGFVPGLYKQILSISGLGENPNVLVQAVIILLLLIIVFNNAGEISQLRASKNELGMNISILNAEVKRLNEITALAETMAEPGDMNVIRQHKIEKLGV